MAMFGQRVAQKMGRHEQDEGRFTQRIAEKMGRHDQDEGHLTKTIEKQTASLPSTLFLVAAGASILGAMGLRMSGRKDDSQFVGQWAPTFLILGLYNKIVKTMGHD